MRVVGLAIPRTSAAAFSAVSVLARMASYEVDNRQPFPCPLPFAYVKIIYINDFNFEKVEFI